MINILHIGNIRNRPQSGVSTIVPKHIINQSLYANVSLLNLDDFTPMQLESIPCTHYHTDTINKTLDTFKPDLVVFHEIFWMKYLSIYKKLVCRNIPYIIVPHGSSTATAQKQKRVKKIIANKLAFDKFVKNASAIHYLSEYDKSESIYQDMPAIVQGSGIETNKRLKDTFSVKGMSLIYIGRLDIEVKGLDLILRAVKDYKTQFIDLNLSVTIAGADAANGLKKIKKFIKVNGLGDIITLKPALFADDKIQEILKHDVFFQLSRTEAQCLGLMEAMSIGMPSIVTRGTSFFTSAIKYGIAHPTESTPRDVMNSILYLHGNKSLLYEMSSRSSSYINDNFNWGRCSSNMIEHYLKHARLS